MGTLMQLNNFIKELLPSSKLQHDTAITYNQCGNLKPISLEDLSLITPIKKRIITLRKNNNRVKLIREQKKLSLIIPYRHREEHKKIFLPFIHNLLEKQKIDYEIIIAEQTDSFYFNRAKLMNIAALEAQKESEYFIFHDIDALPIDVDYRYCNQTLKTYNYVKREKEFELYPQTVFGGATLVPKEIFYAINGFSNNYWQWGKEDDDFLLRHLFKGYIPFLDTQGKLDMLPHPRALKTDQFGQQTDDKKILQQNKNLSNKNKKYFSKFKRGIISQDDDGINSIKNYTISSIETVGKVKTVKIAFQEY